MSSFTDPDLLINWERIDNPGDNPLWRSKCGLVEQRTFGDSAFFHGFVGDDKHPIPQAFTISLISAKSTVEREYRKDAVVKWDY